MFAANVSSASALCSVERFGSIGSVGWSSQKASGKVMKTYVPVNVRSYRIVQVHFQLTFSRCPTETASIPARSLGGSEGIKISLFRFKNPNGVVISTSSNDKLSPFSVFTITLLALFFLCMVCTPMTLSPSRITAFSSGILAISVKIAL